MTGNERGSITGGAALCTMGLVLFGTCVSTVVSAVAWDHVPVKSSSVTVAFPTARPAPAVRVRSAPTRARVAAVLSPGGAVPAPPAAPAAGTSSGHSIAQIGGTLVTFTVLPAVVVHLDQFLRPVTVRTNTLHRPRSSDTWTAIDADGIQIPVTAAIRQDVLEATESWSEHAFGDPAADSPLR